MTTLLHISDTHFGTEQVPVVEALARLSAHLAPELLVLSGDITQRARPAQFAAARRFVDRLGVPFISIAGNHDIPLWNVAARLMRPYAGYQKAFGETLEPVHDSAAALVVCVKTTRRYRHAKGEVSAAQRERVAARLRGARPGQLRVVVVHQPLYIEGDTHGQVADKHLLRGRSSALQSWAAAGADLALGGHIHLPCVRELTPAGAGGARIVVAQAGTALSNRLRHGVPNSVNVIRHDAAARACSIERWDCAGDGSDFQLVETRQFSLDRPTELGSQGHPQRAASPSPGIGSPGL